MDRNQKAKLEYQKMAEERDAVERARRYVDAIEKLSPFTSHGNERTSSGKVRGREPANIQTAPARTL